MNILLGIPTGQRADEAVNCVDKWRKAIDCRIAVATWDDETHKRIHDKVDYIWNYNTMYSYAHNHNRMAELAEWDAYICGADDLFPEFGMERIEEVVNQYQGYVIWVKDGLFNQQMTHPIITRKWYDKYKYIFDEDYKHNFCDTDLMVRTLRNKELVKCFNIGFDHRHPLKTGRKKDMIYKIGDSYYAEDEKTFISKHGRVPISTENLVELELV